MGVRVDAHHHIWQYSEHEYGWLEGSLSGLRRDFLPEELFAAMHSAGVDGAVAVQARQTLDETDSLLRLAAESPQVMGVVGWLPIAEPEFSSLLERYRAEIWLKGIRHVVQAEPAGFLDDFRFNERIDLLASTELVYDLLVFERQLEEVIRFVDRHPHQRFILDHIGKPRIAAGDIEPWATRVRELGLRPHVTCKLSGMVTEADPHRWTADQLRPYFEIALEAFTPSRLMIGTDWPVLTASCTYAGWWEIVKGWMAPLSTDEQDDILGGTCVRAYGLDLSGLQ